MDEPSIFKTNRLARFGPYLGITGSVVFLVLWFAAVQVTGDWVLGEHTLSELGGKDNLAAPLFNFACVFAGVCMFLFAFSVWMRIPELRQPSGFMRIAGLGLVLVGVFNIDTGLAHDLATLLFFSMIAIGVGSAAYIQVKNWMLLPTAFVGLGGMCVSFLSLGLATIPMTEAIAVTCIAMWGITLSTEMLMGRD